MGIRTKRLFLGLAIGFAVGVLTGIALVLLQHDEPIRYRLNRDVNIEELDFFANATSGICPRGHLREGTLLKEEMIKADLHYVSVGFAVTGQKLASVAEAVSREDLDRELSRSAPNF